jgi:hypothetical protein
MPDTLFEVWSFQNMTMKLSRWHKSPIIRNALKKIIAAQAAARRPRAREVGGRSQVPTRAAQLALAAT